MGFLLLDDPKEAFDYAKGAFEKAPKYPIKNFLRCMLVNGKENIVQNWHLKLLCAFVLVITEFHKDRYPLAELNHDESPSSDLVIMPLLPVFSEPKRISLVNDYLMWCKKVIGQEDAFLCTYRTQLYKLFKTMSLNDTVQFFNLAYQSINGKTVCSNMIDAIQTDKSHSFRLLLDIISEGHLSNPDAFQKILEQSTMSTNIHLFVDSIAPSDFPAKKKIKEKVKYVTVPAGRSSLQSPVDGKYMENGACLIINQLHEHESDENIRRYGTEKDEEDMISVMSKIGCENNIKIKRDLTADEIEKCLKEFRDSLDKTVPDFSVVIILSHGRQNPKTGQDEICGIDWESKGDSRRLKGVRFSKIRNGLIDGKKCPVMIGKPKLFFIQACRGIHENMTIPDANKSDLEPLSGMRYVLIFRYNQNSLRWFK